MPYIYPTRAAAKAAFKYGKPLVYSQRGVLDPNAVKFRALKKRIYINLVEKPIMRRASTLVALTQRELQNYQALGISSHCTIIPNGIEISDCKQQPDDGFNAELGIKPGSQVILFLSRVHPTKGADKLLQAFIKIGADFPNAVLVLAGPDEFGLEAEFRQSVRKAGLINRVIFPGMVTGGFKRNLLARADLFVLPSFSEGFSVAILEALASNTAVILSPGCNFAEVESAGAGIIVDPAPDTLADALSGLLSDPNRLAEMGAAGMALASQYSWDAVVDKLEDLYRSLASHTKAR